MENNSNKFATVDDYLAALPEKAERLMTELRAAIKEAAPLAEELISYNMPAFRLLGVLCYYAAHKEHIGFYPGSAKTIAIFSGDLNQYKTSKGTVQFPIDRDLPRDLVKKIVAFRVRENLERDRIKREKRKSAKK